MLKWKNLRQTEMGKLFFENSDKLFANLCRLVVFGKLVTFLVARVSANRANVDHAVSELDESAALDGDVEIGNVVQTEVGKFLVAVFANELDEAVGRQFLAQLECLQAVFGEAVVEEGRDGGASRLAELFFLLDEVGAADEANGDFLTQLAKQGEDLWGSGLQPLLVFLLC